MNCGVWMIVAYIIGSINMIGLVGLLLVDWNIMENLDEFYISLSDTSIRSDCTVEFYLIIIMIIFILLFYIFLLDDDYMVGAIISLSLYYCCAVAVVLFSVFILVDQSQEDCSMAKIKGEEFLSTYFNGPVLIRGVKMYGLRLSNLTDYSTLISIVVDDNCQFGNTLRWVFIGFASPTIFLVVFSFFSCFLPLCLD